MSDGFDGACTFSVVIADDQKEWRDRVRAELEKSFPHRARPIVEISDLGQVVAQCKSRKPDLIFLDIQFDGANGGGPKNGIEAAREIWEELPNAAIVINSSYTSEEYVHDLYDVVPDTAAYGWLVKSRLARDLSTATRAVLEGDCWVDSDVERIESRIDSREKLDKKLHETLIYVALGYSQRAIGALCKVTAKAVEKRLEDMYVQLGLPMKHGKQDDQVASGVVNHRCRAVWMGFEKCYITEAELRARKLTLPDDEELKDIMIRHEVGTKPQIRSTAKWLTEYLVDRKPDLFDDAGKKPKSGAPDKREEFLGMLQDTIARCLIEKELGDKDYHIEIPVKAVLFAEASRRTSIMVDAYCEEEMRVAISPGDTTIVRPREREVVWSSPAASGKK